MFQLNVITAIILIIIAIILRLTYIIIMNACSTKKCPLLVSPLLQKRKKFENNSLVCYMCKCTSGHMIVIDILKFDVRYFEEFNHASRILEYSQTKWLGLGSGISSSTPQKSGTLQRVLHE